MEALKRVGVKVLQTSSPVVKAQHTAIALAELDSGTSVTIPNGDDLESPPVFPARPAQPVLVAGNEMKRPKVPLPVYLLHSLAHIELNAIGKNNVLFHLIAGCVRGFYRFVLGHTSAVFT